MRTYGSKARKSQAVPRSNSSSPEPPASGPSGATKRPLEEPEASRTSKRARPSPGTTRSKPAAKPKQKSLTQLHFCVDQPIIRRCPLCDLRYTKGAAEDVALHKAHCARVQKGMEWSKEEEREGYGTCITEVRSRIKLGNGRIGKIISFPTDAGGKIGTKLSNLLQTVNLCLSAPPLSKSTLRTSKAYLFLIPQDGPAKSASIVGCVIAQRIETAMDVIPPDSSGSVETEDSPKRTIEVAGVFCHPQQLPTPMGISRIFVSSKHRRQGIARALLDAAAETFIPGCHLDPLQSQIAFSQPTGDGNKVMQAWGRGRIRIYDED